MNPLLESLKDRINDHIDCDRYNAQMSINSQVFIYDVNYEKPVITIDDNLTITVSLFATRYIIDIVLYEIETINLDI